MTTIVATRQEIESAATQAGMTAKQMHEEAGVLVVDCPAAYEYGGNLLRTIRLRLREVNESRLKITRKMDEAKAEVMNLYRPHVALLEADDATVDKKLTGWRQEEERLRQAEEARLRQEALAREAKEREKAEKKIEKLETSGKQEEADLVRASVPEAAPLPVVESAVPKVKGLGVQANWKFEIVDAAKIPREYLVPDEVAIGKVVRALKDKTNIAGIRVYKEEGTSVRRTPF